jgi:hypothetical protein
MVTHQILGVVENAGHFLPLVQTVYSPSGYGCQQQIRGKKIDIGLNGVKFALRPFPFASKSWRRVISFFLPLNFTCSP